MIKHIFIDHKTKSINNNGGAWPNIKKGCIWIYGTSISEEEKQNIAKEFDIPLIYLKTYTRETRSKRYSTRPLIFVMVDYFCEEKSVKKTNILIIIKKDVFITIVPERFSQYDKMYDEILEYLKEQTKVNRNIGEILYEFLDRDLQDNYEVLRITEEKIAEMEKKVIDREKGYSLQEVVSLKKELFMMSRRFWSTAKLVFLLRKGLVSIDISKKTESLLLDIYDTFQHQIEVLETQREMLNDIITLYETFVSNSLAVISNDLSVVMKKLTSLTVILLIPSLIAGIYGMNFNYLPRADSPTGFFEMIGLMIILVGLMYYLFHKKKWV